MMNCNDTKVFLAEWKRFCTWHFKEHDGEYKVCEKCMLRKDGAHCNLFITNHPEEAIRLLQRWSDSHPVKTRLSVFLETFPNAVMKSKGALPLSCARLIFGFDNCEGKNCTDCWNTPIEQGVQ